MSTPNGKPTKSRSAFSPSRLWESFGYAFKGLGHVFANEANMRFHCAMAIAVILAGFVFKVSPGEWCLLVLCISGIMAAEAFNSAIEALTDLASPKPHPLAGRAKDVAAGAVTLMAIGAALVGLIVFLPKIMAFLNL